MEEMRERLTMQTEKWHPKENWKKKKRKKREDNNINSSLQYHVALLHNTVGRHLSSLEK